MRRRVDGWRRIWGWMTLDLRTPLFCRIIGGRALLRPTLGRVVDGSTGGAGLYPHGCGLYLEKSLLCPLALSRSVGADTAYSQDQSQDRQWEARNYRWKLRILYVAVSPFEYHQGELQYVASYS